MNFSGVLDLVIGLVFLFLVFSLIASGIYETGARILESRSRLLWNALRDLLDGDADGGDQRPVVGAAAGTALTERLYAHPLIRQLEEQRATDLFQRSRVSHIPPGDFGRALVDVLVPAGTTATSVDALRSAIDDADLPDELKRSLLPLAADAGATLDHVRRDIGDWFDGRMDVASRIYKRNTRWIMVAIGFVVALGFNVDALGATQELYQDDAMRAAITEQATGIVEACTASEQGQPTDHEKIAECARDEIDKIEGGTMLPVGWTEGRTDIDGWHVLGWLIAGIAVAQGAPFWFDLLRRASGLRK